MIRCGASPAISAPSNCIEPNAISDNAIAAWQEALDRYERKQIIPLARRVRERLDACEKRRGARERDDAVP